MSDSRYLQTQKVWSLNPENKILPCNIKPGNRIAWHVEKWGMLYKAQVAQVEILSETKVRIKAGESNYTFWHCTWHVLDSNTVVYLLGK